MTGICELSATPDFKMLAFCNISLIIYHGKYYTVKKDRTLRSYVLKHSCEKVGGSHCSSTGEFINSEEVDQFS